MSRLTASLASCLALTLAAPQAHAMILYGAGNSATTTNPGAGVPWANVGAVTNAGGTSRDASVVYLGNRYVLTANHVGAASFVTFDESTVWSRDTGFTPVRIGGTTVDLLLFRLDSDPGLPSISVWDGPAQGDYGVHVGFGVGRDGTAINSNTVGWGTDSTRDKRWGENAPVAAGSLTYGTSPQYTSDVLITVLGNTQGATEAGLTAGDSGSGFFQFLSGQWRLTGIASAVQAAGSSTFGNDSSNLSDPGRGHVNILVALGNYKDDIDAAMGIPEPATWVLFSGVAAMGLIVWRRRFGLAS